MAALKCTNTIDTASLYL